MLTDTHTHLYSESFEQDRKEMIARAMNAGVSRFFVPAIDSAYHNAMHELAKDYPNNIFLMMGLHPTHVKENYQEELALAKQQLATHPFYAVGEIGIDLYWDKTYLKQQQDAFKIQIEWALEKKLPIVIHARNSFEEIFEILDDFKTESLTGIFHCFSGSHAQAKKIITNYNMKLGIGGVVTFKNGKIDAFLNEIPIEHLVLETDAPYLAPVPYRGKRNESSYLPIICEKLANIYHVSTEEIARITSENATKVFRV
jgi:TatD DNase family protein